MRGVLTPLLRVLLRTSGWANVWCLAHQLADAQADPCVRLVEGFRAFPPGAMGMYDGCALRLLLLSHEVPNMLRRVHPMKPTGLAGCTS